MPLMRSVNKLLMFSSIATEVPQCNSTQNDESKSDANCISNAALKTNADDSGGLNSLPDDVLFQVLLYCGPCDVDEGIKFVSKRLQ